MAALCEPILGDPSSKMLSALSLVFWPIPLIHSYVGSVTSEFKKGVCGIFEEKKLGKNWHIPPNISATAGPIFTKLSA